jgi:magnesium transporter
VDGLAETQDLIGKVGLCLMDGQRDIRFLVRQPAVPKKHGRQWTHMLGNIEMLLPHNAFLSARAGLLLNAAQGFANIELARIMKVCFIADVVLLPPTLIEAIYGMNFRIVPELHRVWGYPVALGLMMVPGVTRYLRFKQEGWL